MKITHQGARFEALTGFYTDEVVFSDGTKGKIEFNFLWNVEFNHMEEVTSGLLVIGPNQSVTFSKIGLLHLTKLGAIPERISASEIISEHIGKVVEAMQRVEVEVKFKNI